MSTIKLPPGTLAVGAEDYNAVQRQRAEQDRARVSAALVAAAKAAGCSDIAAADVAEQLAPHGAWTGSEARVSGRSAHDAVSGFLLTRPHWKGQAAPTAPPVDAARPFATITRPANPASALYAKGEKAVADLRAKLGLPPKGAK
jgi:hypothetical protein